MSYVISLGSYDAANIRPEKDTLVFQKELNRYAIMQMKHKPYHHFNGTPIKYERKDHDNTE